MSKLFCIVGETASGKDTIVNSLFNWMKAPNNLKKVVSFTTREKRVNETEGVEHYFVSNKEYDLIHDNSKVIAETKIGDIRYMSTEKECMCSDIYIIDPAGLEFLKSHIDKNLIDIVSIYIYAPLDVRKARSVIRNNGVEDPAFLKRMEDEHEQFIDFYNKKRWDYCVYNGDKMLNASVKTVESIINFELNERYL